MNKDTTISQTDIPEKLKERFTKDLNLPIKIFKEPYFSERIELINKIKPGTKKQYEDFKEIIKKYNTPQDYLEEYNKIKDNAINYIKNSNLYEDFQHINMDIFSVTDSKIPERNIYTNQNTGKEFISIDIRKANFTALRQFSPGIFNFCITWEDFMKKFTENQHIIKSKYIRQVILGNCNPKRQITIEKYLTNNIVNEIKEAFPSLYSKIISFAHDEIIIDITEEKNARQIFEELIRYLSFCPIPLKIEGFRLYQIKGTSGYLKMPLFEARQPEIKGIQPYLLPFAIKKLLNEEYTENDKVFVFEGQLAKLIETPEIEISGKPV